MKKNIVYLLKVLLVGLFMLFIINVNDAYAYKDCFKTPELTGVQDCDIVNIAKSQLGYVKENGTVYGKWYTLYTGSSYEFEKQAWCAMFMSWCANKAGIAPNIIPRHASCSQGVKMFSNMKVWHDRKDYNPKRGDIIYFTYSHVGIVTKVDSKYVYTIEGNKNSLNSGVGEGKYLLNNSKIKGYASPQYIDTSSFVVPKRILRYDTTNMKGNDIKWLQNKLCLIGYNIKIDGTYNKVTENAVKSFQKKYGLSVDGKVGPATISKIKNVILEKESVPEKYFGISQISSIKSEEGIGQVTGFKVKNIYTDRLVLTWNKINDVNGYVLERYDVKSKSYKIVKNIKSNVFTNIRLNAATTYKYKIRAYKLVNNKIIYGDYSQVLIAMTKPKKIKNLRVVANGKGKVTVIWDRQNAVTGYEVYRANFNVKNMKLRKVISNNKSNYFINIGLDVGKNYFYKVRSYKLNGKLKVYGDFSNVNVIKVK